MKQIEKTTIMKLELVLRKDKIESPNIWNLKAFVKQSKLLTKQKDNLWNGRKYSQMMGLTRA